MLPIWRCKHGVRRKLKLIHDYSMKTKPEITSALGLTETATNEEVQARLDALLTEKADEFLAMRVKHRLETNDAAPTVPRAFLATDGTIEIGGHYPRTSYTESDMERNGWVEEFTAEMVELTNPDLEEAIQMAEVENGSQVDVDSLVEAYLAVSGERQYMDAVITVRDDGWCCLQPRTEMGCDEAVICRREDVQDQFDAPTTETQVREWIRATESVAQAQRVLDELVLEKTQALLTTHPASSKRVRTVSGDQKT